jgi:hypothetical protein
MNDKPVIPTIYKGVRMKSRLEADVAFLLDRLGWPWEYEPQSFLLENGYHYVPDFHVPRWNLWIEAMDYEPPKEEKAQLEGFAQYLPELPSDYPFETYLVVKHVGATLACMAVPMKEALPTLVPGGFFAYCFHCKQWVFQDGPDEEGLWCPECFPAQGQITRWFRVEGRKGALYVCADQQSWRLREWVAGYAEQQDRWENTRRTISCAYCCVIFEKKEPGTNIIALGPGEPLPVAWVAVSHEGISDYYCSQICAASSLLSTIVNSLLKQDQDSPIGRHIDAYREVANVLYDLGPGKQGEE